MKLFTQYNPQQINYSKEMHSLSLDSECIDHQS